MLKQDYRIVTAEKIAFQHENILMNRSVFKKGIGIKKNHNQTISKFEKSNLQRLFKYSYEKKRLINKMHTHNKVKR